MRLLDRTAYFAFGESRGGTSPLWPGSTLAERSEDKVL
jgi:hypothetical protein